MNTTVVREKCGTYAGYQAHTHAEPPEPTCNACREANARYHQERRARGGDVIERAAAAARALWRLKDLHRAEFDLLVEDEMRVERNRARGVS